MIWTGSEVEVKEPKGPMADMEKRLIKEFGLQFGKKYRVYDVVRRQGNRCVKLDIPTNDPEDAIFGITYFEEV